MKWSANSLHCGKMCLNKINFFSRHQNEVIYMTQNRQWNAVFQNFHLSIYEWKINRKIR